MLSSLPKSFFCYCSALSSDLPTLLETKGTKELKTISRSSSIWITPPFTDLSRKEDRKRETTVEELVRQIKERKEKDKKKRWFRR
jgi:hypothetical protein